MSLVRPLIAGVLGAFAILCVAYAVLAMTVPSHGASGCSGKVVVASWYGTESGDTTANGEPFNGTSMTAAMPSRKYLGRTYRVTRKDKSVTVRINDVGPAAWTGRGIDVSKAVARKLGFIRAGTASVCLERLR